MTDLYAIMKVINGVTPTTYVVNQRKLLNDDLNDDLRV